MAKFNKLQNNFKSGQLSQLLDGRTDLNEYAQGLKTMKNAYPMRQGGAQKRSGTKFIEDISNSIHADLRGNALKAIPFTLSDNTKYIFVLVADRDSISPFRSYNVLLKEVEGEFEDVTSSEYDMYNSLSSGASNDTLRKCHFTTYGNQVFIARGFNEFTAGKKYTNPTVLYRTLISQDFQPGDYIFGSDQITITGHSFRNKDQVNITGTLPTFSESQPFYVKRIDDNTVELYKEEELTTKVTITTGSEAGTQTIKGTGLYFRFNTIDQFLDDGNASLTAEVFKRNKILARGWQLENTADITMAVSTATVGTGRTLQASTDYFIEDHVGSYFRAHNLTTEGVCVVTGYTDAQNVTVEVLIAFPSTSALFTWRESAWSDARGYPGTVTSFEGRVVWGGTESEPGTIDFSHTDDSVLYMVAKLKQDEKVGGAATDSGLNYYGPIVATDAKKLGFKDTIDKRIAFLSGGRSLEVGTSKDVKILNAPEGVGAGTPSFSVESESGAEAIQTVRADQSTLYAEALIGISNFTLNTEIETRDRYISKQLSLLNEEIIEGDVQSMYFDSFRKITYIVLLINGAYVLKGLYFDSIDDTAAWFEPDFTDAGTLADIYTIAGFDESPHLYVLTSRKDDSVYLEKLEGADTKLKEAELDYLDCHITGNNSGSNLITGLGHLYALGGSPLVTVVGNLAGETNPVRPIVFSDLSVSALGEVTLPSNVDDYTVGLRYTAEIETMSVDGGLNIEGSSQGQIKRIDEVTLRMWNSTSLDIGDENATFPVKFDDDTLYTGDKVVKFDQGSSSDNRVKLLSANPYPMFLTGLIIKGVTYE